MPTMKTHVQALREAHQKAIERIQAQADARIKVAETRARVMSEVAERLRADVERYLAQRDALIAKYEPEAPNAEHP